MFPSQNKLKTLLQELRSNQTESKNVDGKLDLILETPGDYAYFIRHISALANNRQTGYLIIGVEDKTWDIKGLTEESPLRDADNTQRKMNQILAKRLDPALNIRYRTYEVDNASVGLVLVEGDKAPYVISIEDAQYGGDKTRGKSSYIYRGVIYIRRGDNSVIANRQSEILQIVEGRVDIVGAVISLTFIAVLVGSGVGVGVSLLKFVSPSVAAIFGLAWGIVIGWIFNQRISESLGSLFKDFIAGELIRGSIGPLWGAFIGAFLSHSMVSSVLNGRARVDNPVMMGVIIGPCVAVLFVMMIMITLFIVIRIISGRV